MAQPDFLQPPADLPTVRTISDGALQKRDQAFGKYNIKTEKVLSDVGRIYNMLAEGQEPVAMHDGEVVMVPLGRDRISSLRAAMDACFKLLNKTMPDVKQIVVQDETDTKARFDFTMILGDEG